MVTNRWRKRRFAVLFVNFMIWVDSKYTYVCWYSCSFIWIIKDVCLEVMRHLRKLPTGEVLFFLWPNLGSVQRWHKTEIDWGCLWLLDLRTKWQGIGFGDISNPKMSQKVVQMSHNTYLWWMKCSAFLQQSEEYPLAVKILGPRFH